ncbi:NAD(P)H-dependent oxidoreductase subunit E [Candidatus Poribacteria bacterium]|nr:NAD(P)H-dependent oxidoreductase subunit E [Candidatus Poribacteria bacterium]
MGQVTLQPDYTDVASEENHLLDKLRNEFEGRPDDLIPMLQYVQKTLGYLPEGILLEISRLTSLPAARVFGVVTFYAQFRLKPIGKYTVKLCRGTACHVNASAQILEDVCSYLNVEPGETTKDGLFTLEIVACFGSCALAPVVVIDESVYGLMNSSKTRKLLDGLRKEQREETSQHP